jgi:hypothetical protein
MCCLDTHSNTRLHHRHCHWRLCGMPTHSKSDAFVKAISDGGRTWYGVSRIMSCSSEQGGHAQVSSQHPKRF